MRKGVKKTFYIKLLIVGNKREKINVNNSFINDIHVVGCADNALPYINLCDILVYSINKVLPLNIIEGFYCEKPVGGVNEIIEDNYLKQITIINVLIY